MVRYSAPDLEELVWVEVTAERPCPVCGDVNECRMLEAEAFVYCVQKVSEWPLLGIGWVHRLTNVPESAALTLV